MQLPSVSHLKLKSHLTQSVRQFLSEKQFEEVFTPLLVSEVNTEPHIEYFQVGPHYLIASPELKLKEYLFSLWSTQPRLAPKIFQLGPVFRAGPSEKSPLHHNEFLMLEYYFDCPSLTEGIHFFNDLLSHVFKKFHCYVPPVLQIHTVSDVFYQRTGLHLNLESSECLLEALKKFNPHSNHLKNKSTRPLWNDLFFEVYVCAIEPWLATQELVALTHYPRSITSMALPNVENPLLVERFEVHYRGVELCNGYMECFQPSILKKQMEYDQTMMAQKRSLPHRWLEKCEFNWLKNQNNIPPICGLSAGIERLCWMILQHQKEGLGEGIQSFIHSGD